MSEKPCARQAPRNVTLAQYASRRRCHPDTIRRNPHLMAHAIKDSLRLEWPESFVAADCAALPAPVDPNEYPYTRAGVARLTGWSLRWLELHREHGKHAHGLASLYSDEDVRRLLVARGKIGEEAVIWALEARNRQQLVYLVETGQLRKPTTVADDGSCLWHDPAGVLERCAELLSFLNSASDRNKFAQGYQDAATREPHDVLGLAELDQWALEQADRVAARKREATLTKRELRIRAWQRGERGSRLTPSDRASLGLRH